MKYNKLLHHW